MPAESSASSFASTSKLLYVEEKHENINKEVAPIVKSNKAVQTEINIEDIRNMKLELSKAFNMHETFKNQVIMCDNLKDESMVKYYTGLSTYKHFEVLIEICSPYLKSSNTKLPPKEQILLTFMKLRLNLYFKDLAFRFGISPSTVSTYFKNVVHVMYARLKTFVFWPAREIIKKTMPSCFREAFHEKTTVIIDCFEIRAQTPSDMLTAAQSYKY